MYTVFFISFVVSSTCFVCYLHPSSGAQLQRTAIGCVSVENRGFSIKWCGGLFFMDLYVLVFQSLAWYLCAGVCVSLDLFWYCVVMICGFLADSLCALCTDGFGVLFHWSTYWCGTPLHLSTVSYRLVWEGFARRVLGFRVVVAFGLWLVE
jgi:hypothetical protein